MKRSVLTLAAALLFSLACSAGLRAGEAPPANPYAGDLSTRSTLSGDWWGMRNQLAEKGVTLDFDMTQIGQGVVGGGKSGAWQYGGRADLVLNLDSQKLGLWPGGFFNFEMEGNWASAVNKDSGALMPVNSSHTLPLPPGGIFGVPAWNFTQFLSPYFGLSLGKYATVTSNSGDMNEFAHGKGDTQFMNMALNFNPLIAATVPYSTLGTGLIVLPTKDPKQAIVSLFVMSANGKANTSGFEDLNGNAIVVAAEGRLTTDFFSRTGHQLIGTTFSNKTFTSIDQRLASIVELRSLSPEKGSWNIYYNFDQYLYEPKKGADRGIGVFGRLGVSDGNPNPMKFFGSFGVGGKGVFESRPHDQFGVGYYYINIDHPSLTGPLKSVKFLRDEYGFEGYYNFALTPWAMLTPDIQIVRGSQKDKLSIVQGPLGLLPRVDKSDINTSTVLGIRLKVVF